MTNRTIVVHTSIALVLLTGVLLHIVSCAPRHAVRSMQSDMRDAYQVSADLFYYTWNKRAFFNSKHEADIASLLQRLSADFHSIERNAPIELFEPGFRITLATHQQQLADIHKRFVAGDKDYANWRLRGMAMNCVACHTRHQVSTDFVGDLPVVQEQSFDARLGRAQFLIATRQFEHASNELYQLAQSISRNTTQTVSAMEPLRLWLLVQVRVKSKLNQAADQLAALRERGNFTTEQTETLQAWEDDMRTLAERRSPPHPLLVEAQELMQDLPAEPTIDQSDRHLVKTLRATAVLHRVLEGRPPKETRQQASLLLARANLRLPIPSLDVFKELYLEQVIREFPETTEAQQAFLLLDTYVEQTRSGSSGLHLEPEERAWLKELRQLAFGNPQLILQDSLPLREGYLQ